MSEESRFRSPRAQGQPQAQATSRIRRTEDPLAELARLIGQEDPFAEFVAHRPADARNSGNLGIPRRTRPPEGRGYDGRPSDRVERRRPVARAPEPAYDGADDEFAEAPRSNGRGAYAYGGTRVPRADDVSPRSYRDEGARAPSRPQPNDGEPDAALHHEHERPGHAEARHARRAPARHDVDDPAYDQFPGEDYDPDYVDDGYLPAHGDEFYEEAPRRRLKPMLLAGVAAAAIIIVGASGLFAYRAVFGVTENAPPVTIRPEAGPTKMVPGGDSKTAEAGGNKQIYDRVGGDPAPSGERIVSREEDPIGAIAAANDSGPSRVTAGTVSAVPQTAEQPAPPPTFSTEPRRVRTVTVRADGTVVPNPGSAPAGNTQGTSATAPEGNTSSSAPANNAPLALNNPSGQGTASAPSLPPARPSATAAPRSGDNPWASTSNSGQLSAPQPTTQAALSPQATPGAAPSNPPPVVAVNTPPPAGSYVVQVAAQKSEEAAQASWLQLQQRYSSILGDQQAAIRRVDLGERGVFYRAQVGPFTSRAQASEVCQSLKAAGGACVIQRN